MTHKTAACLLIIFHLLCGALLAQEKASPAPAPSKSSAAAGSDLVVMRVAGEPITENQIIAAISLLAQQKQSPTETAQQRNLTLYNGAVENAIIETLLRHEARRQNIVADQAKVDQQMQQITRQFPTQEEFQKALASQGLTEAALRKNIAEAVSMQQVIDLAIKDAVPSATDAEIQKYYDANPQRFMNPERVRAAHILLLVNKGAAPEQKEELKKKLEGIRADIESAKITFADAAAKYSQDTENALKGGDLGLFARGLMVKAFEEVAFSAEPGSLSQIIETEFGYHIIRVIEKKPAGKSTLEEVKADIKRFLEQASRRKATQQYAGELKAKATIETFMTPEEFIKRHMAGR